MFPDADARVVKVSLKTTRDGCQKCAFELNIINPEVIIITNICHHHNINIMSHFRGITVLFGVETINMNHWLLWPNTTTEMASWILVGGLFVVAVINGKVAAPINEDGDYILSIIPLKILLMTLCSWPQVVFSSLMIMAALGNLYVISGARCWGEKVFLTCCHLSLMVTGSTVNGPNTKYLVTRHL